MTNICLNCSKIGNSFFETVVTSANILLENNNNEARLIVI